MTSAGEKPQASVTVGATFIAVQLMWFIGGGAFVWILRDGLGPEAVTTTGAAALVRMFETFYWGPVGVVLLVVDTIWWFRRRRHGRR
ncbi:MAG: hypothetical protein ACI9F9_000508 [Candidatus Paceibacteria bacterium]|jgi:hypothetical protein